APQTKVGAIEGLGAKAVRLPYARWWQVLEDHGYPGIEGLFIHPVSDPAVMAGNGTIGLEILEDLPKVDAVVVPFGGGGLSCGIAAAMRALSPKTKVYAAEAATSTPLKTSLERNEAGETPRTRSLVDGIGGPRVCRERFELSKQLLAGSLVATLDEIAAAIRLLVERNRVVAEGAAGAAVAAAIAGRAGTGTVVAIVSGGNIDTKTLATILEGRTP